MIVHEFTVVNSVLYVKVSLVGWSCLRKRKNIIIYECNIVLLTCYIKLVKVKVLNVEMRD